MYCLFLCCSRLQGGKDAHARSMLAKLEASFKWELRTLWFGPLFVIVFFFSRQVGFIILALMMVALIATDGAFSIVVTMIFIRPISRVLREGGRNVARHSKGRRGLQKTMYMTLFGSSLAVFSSTALYITAIVNAVQPGSLESPWSHALVFGINLDSILNDVGMLFVCGVLKNAKWAHVANLLAKFPASLKKKTRYVIEPEKEEACAFDSSVKKAYDDDGEERKHVSSSAEPYVIEPEKGEACAFDSSVKRAYDDDGEERKPVSSSAEPYDSSVQSDGSAEEDADGNTEK